MQLRLSVVVAVAVAGLSLIAACSGRAAEPVAPAGPVAMPMYGASQHALQLFEPGVPWALTASDGSGLVLTRVDAKAVFEGPLAFTELHLYFHNPEPRIREGTFAIALPAHAAVSRFAMENAGQWMEAEVVERSVARRAYEDFLHRRQDPALLEKAEGNQFTARVFPIPAGGDKHLVLSFSQELPGERFVLPLRGLPKIERVDVRLATLGTDGHHSEQVLAQRNWQPDRDFVSDAPVAAEAIAAGTLVAAQLAVLDRAGSLPAADPPAAITMLVDTSASRMLGFRALVDNLGKLIGALRQRHGDGLQLQVVAFDQSTAPIFSGRAADWGAAQAEALIARGAAGASDLAQALAWVTAHQPHPRLVVVTDAVVTAGAALPSKIAGPDRIDVVLSGGIRDDDVAATLVRAATRPGAVVDLDRGVDDVAAALGERVLVDVAIEVPGASWSYPRSIASVRAGTRVMVYAGLRAPAPALTAVVNGHRRTIGIVGAAPALVERAVAAAAIGELEVKLASAAPEARAALKAEIAKRSVAARVVSSQTALLVLETEDDYERYGIDRKALIDILEVAGDQVVQRHRKLAIAAPAPERHVRRLEPNKSRKAKAKKTKQAADEDEDDDGTDQKRSSGFDKEDKSAELAGGDDGEGGGEEDDAKELSERNHDFAPRSRDARITARPPEPEPEAPARVASDPPRREPPPAAPPPPPSPLSQPSSSSSSSSSGRITEIASEREAWPPKGAPAPLTGELAEIMRAPRSDAALALARRWRDREPANVLALIGLGEALEAHGAHADAARMYGSIIDLFPRRADLRRFAGERLERIGEAARALAIDTYRRAVEDRPDHLTGHRLLAYALLRAGRHADAFAAILAGLERKYPEGRFRGGERVLADDAGLIGAAYAAAVPARRAEIAAALAAHHTALASAPSTRFILYWETDANDVDFHIQDARGGHAWYSSKQLPSGGELYEDVTTGYGPECFAIPGVAKAGPYRLSINYYSQGPMGYGMGLLQIVRHDGKGKLAFEDRPYIIMTNQAYVDLGTYR